MSIISISISMLTDKAKTVLDDMVKEFNIDKNSEDYTSILSILILHQEDVSKEVVLKAHSELVEPYEITEFEKIAVDRLYS